jgi:hypothetical protein
MHRKASCYSCIASGNQNNQHTRHQFLPKIPDNPQVGNVKTDETGFGGFVTMPLGVFPELFATKP